MKLVDIGPIKGAGGSRSHVQVRVLPTMGRHIQAHYCPVYYGAEGCRLRFVSVFEYGTTRGGM